MHQTLGKSRGADKKGKKMHSFKRNFFKKKPIVYANAFVTSPEMVAANHIEPFGFNPITDTEVNDNGEEVGLTAYGDELPQKVLL
jgi:aconitate hydratase